MSDERFARQYRFGLPSGFPLTSSCTSIVHHLSGPNLYALARLFTKDQVLPEVRLTGPSSRLLYASGFTTLILAHKLDSLVRVSRRVGTVVVTLVLGTHKPRHPNTPANPACEHPRKTKTPEHHDKKPSRCLTPQHRIKGGIHPGQDPNFPPAPYSAAPKSHQSGLKQFKQGTEVTKRTATGAIRPSRFTLNGFTYYFTFFSKFFSSFPHGTCSLSVSSKYLALDGIYHPFSAAVPSNTTLGTGAITGVSQKQ